VDFDHYFSQSLPALFNIFLCPKLLVLILFKFLHTRQPPLYLLALFFYFPLCCSYMTNWWSLIIPNTATFQSCSLSSSSPSERAGSVCLFFNSQCLRSLPSLNSLLTFLKHDHPSIHGDQIKREFSNNIIGEHRIERPKLRDLSTMHQHYCS
jgi:hypothetical protein